MESKIPLTSLSEEIGVTIAIDQKNFSFMKITISQTAHITGGEKEVKIARKKLAAELEQQLVKRVASLKRELDIE